MIKVEGGTFERGKEKQVVTVLDFYIGKFPVTQAVWTAILKENPSRFKGENHPVEQVNWKDIQVFLKKLYGFTGKKYHLPGEAQWEYAARGGRRSEGLQYAGSNKLKEVGWYGENSNGQTQSVGLKLPNELGICDMSGNVFEWCADYWHDGYDSAYGDGGGSWVAEENNHMRVVCGGSWVSISDDCRPSNRFVDITDHSNSSIGFRLSWHSTQEP